MQIDRRRLLSDLRELASIGAFETGVDRTALSVDDMRARAWLRDRLMAAGLDATIDGVGNVYGRMSRAQRAILIGSHTDTVPRGGWLDGSLGVIYGLEIARCIAAARPRGKAGVDVVSFQDEEGTFSALIGSRTFCGEDVGQELRTARNQAGMALSDAIEAAGVGRNPAVRLDRERHIGYLEAHIEQGPRLEASGDRIGVVTAIVGIRSFRLTFTGRADHAGTTPMALRSDAGAAAVTFASRVADAFGRTAGSDTVWNVGGCTFKPGANNVVPAEALLVFQFRDTDDARMTALEAMMRETAEQAAKAARAEVEVVKTLETRPTPMDARLAGLLEAAAIRSGLPLQSLPSGAGHDALVMARYIPAAMLFVPSIGGRSHHISENTSDEDIVAGAEVMLAAVNARLDEIEAA